MLIGAKGPKYQSFAICNSKQGGFRGGGGGYGGCNPPNDFKKPRPPWSEVGKSSSFSHCMDQEEIAATNTELWFVAS